MLNSPFPLAIVRARIPFNCRRFFERLASFLLHWDMELDSAVGALLLSTFSPSPVPFLASSSRRIVLQSSSRRRVVVVGCPVICSTLQKIETEPTKTTSSQPYPGGLGPHTGRDPTIKKPSWLRQRAPQGEKLAKLKESITTLKLNTVCEEA